MTGASDGLKEAALHGAQVWWKCNPRQGRTTLDRATDRDAREGTQGGDAGQKGRAGQRSRKPERVKAQEGGGRASGATRDGGARGRMFFFYQKLINA